VKSQIRSILYGNYGQNCTHKKIRLLYICIYYNYRKNSQNKGYSKDGKEVG
jgi:hypothetical protein